MRTTLDLDEDVLAAAKELARGQRQTLGRTVSQLVRRGLEPEQAQWTHDEDGSPTLIDRRKPIPVTPALVKNILESND